MRFHQKVTVHAQGKAQAQKRSEDPKCTPLQADSWDRHSLQQLKTKQNPGNSGTGQNLISRKITILNSNVQFSTTKIAQRRKVWPIQNRK